MKLDAAKPDYEWSKTDERLVIDTIPALIYTALADGHVDFFNCRLLEYTGAKLDEMVGWQWTNRLHPDDVDRMVDRWRASLKTGEPFETEIRVLRFDGEYRWFLNRCTPLRDKQGGILKWYGAGIDIEDRKRVQDALEQAFQKIKALKDQLQRENIALRDEISEMSMFEEIVGTSPVLKAVLARVAKVAPTDSTVLITGETGTGKELIARAIHKRSRRAARPFVKVSCAATPDSLIASELFGHEKGAFTGALKRRPGRFELADQGTIFLDEIGELPPEAQVALLRVLQEREFERVGGNQSIPVDVRVIAATNRDLRAAIASGDFRSDLFYRINVFPIEVPPLRERPEDIPLLVEYFLDRFARKAGKHISTISHKTLELLRTYQWPGNIRELQNVIERSVILCDGDTLSVDEIWLTRQFHLTSLEKPPLSEKLAEEEIAAIEGALAQAMGRVAGPSGAAAQLGLPPSTLESKIKSLKINKYRFKSV